MWGKVQPGGALPYHGLWGMGTQGTQSPHSRRGIKLGSCRQREPYLQLLCDFANVPTKVKDGTSCLNVSYGLELAKSLGTSKIVHFGVLIWKAGFGCCCGGSNTETVGVEIVGGRPQCRRIVLSSVVRLFRVSHCLGWTKANRGWLDGGWACRR